MKTTQIFITLISLIIFFGFSQPAAADVDTGFTVQGRLLDSEQIADGSYDMQFELYDDPDTGMQIGGTVAVEEIDIIDGYFTVLVDFGSGVLDANSIWLQMGVRSGELADPNTYTTLSPRQLITPAPFALYALDGNEGPQGPAGPQGPQGEPGDPNMVQKIIRDFAVASDKTVTAGDIVAFLNNTVSSNLNETEFGDSTEFNSAATSSISACRLTDTSFAIAYTDEDNSDYGTAIIATVSGTDISYGTEYPFNSAATSNIFACRLTDTSFAIAYADVDNSYYGTAVIATVSGTDITYGSEYEFNYATTSYISACRLTDSSFAVAYRDSTFYGTAVVATVSGTTISYGAEYPFNSASTYNTSVCPLTDTSFAIAYRDGGNSYRGTAIVATVSGTTISYGSEYEFNYATTNYISACPLTDTSFAVAYADNGNSNCGTAIIAEVSGTDISYGPGYVFDTTYINVIPSICRLTDTNFAVTYRDNNNSGYVTVVIATVSDWIISYSSETTFNDAVLHYISACPLTDTNFAVAYSDSLNHGQSIIAINAAGKTPLGVANASAAGDENIPVILYGISDIHSGLTPGKTYYAMPDGSLTTTETSTRVGFSISDTEILLDIER